MENPLILFALAFISALLFSYFFFQRSGGRKQSEREKELKTLQMQKEQLRIELTKCNTELDHARQKLQEQRQEIEELNVRLTKEFEIIANKILRNSSLEVQEKQEEKLMALLKPFKEKIEKFEQKVESTHRESLEKNAALKQQISQLSELNKNIGEEARNLTSALKGDKKLQGDWGEHKLERILQAAGLEKELHYKKQLNLKDEANSNFRPDYVIFLPDGKNLIIDSKVSLVAYEKYFSAETETDATTALHSHIKNVKEHISRLSQVNYSELHGINSPDYVIMYMPIDSALGLAMTEDSSLFEYALNKNIVMVSNNSLLATLKTVAFIWRQDLQNKNALEIARQGGALYDKFVNFVESLQNVGKKLEGAHEDYSKAMKQLSEGSGNLVRRTEQLKELGIKTQKHLPADLTDRQT